MYKTVTYETIGLVIIMIFRQVRGGGVYIQKVSDEMIRYKTNAAAVKTVPNSACVGPHTTA